MKVKQNFSIDSNTLKELQELSKEMCVSQSAILNETLKNGIAEIKAMNYNFSKYLAKRLIKEE